MSDAALIFADLARICGLTRPAGQCFAAIWRAAQPPCADDLCAAAGLSRSNVSTALRELRDHGLIAAARAPGDRKDYFTAPHDPWDLLRLILAARTRHDLAPIRDRLALAGEEGDGRLPVLAAALDQLVAAGEALGAMAPDALGRLISGAEPGAPIKKKKKKRKG